MTRLGQSVSSRSSVNNLLQTKGSEFLKEEFGLFAVGDAGWYSHPCPVDAGEIEVKSPPIITVEGRSTLIASFSSLRIKSVIQGLNSNVATFVTSSFVDKHRTDTTFTLTL